LTLVVPSIKVSFLPRYYHFYSVPDCLQSSEVLQFWYNSWHFTSIAILVPMQLGPLVLNFPM